MKEPSKKPKKERLIGIDLLRIISVAAIFFYHSQMHLGCRYGIFDNFVLKSGVFMVAFFMLSGFAMFYVYSDNEDFKSYKGIVTFYKKRIISLIPVYWFNVLIFPIYNLIVNKSNFRYELVLMPIELLGLQQFFHSLRGVSHNGGTWFVTCFIMCYAVFPVLFTLAKNLKMKSRIIASVIIAFIILYAPVIGNYFGTESMYADPFFRTAEFSLGMFLCTIWIDIKDKPFAAKYISNPLTFLISFIVFVVAVSYESRFPFLQGDYVLDTRLAMPFFCWLLICSAQLKMPSIANSKLIDYLVAISYAFFFPQLYAFIIIRKYLSIIGIDSNIVKILLSSVVCIAGAILLHELIEKPLRKVFKKILFGQAAA